MKEIDVRHIKKLFLQATPDSKTSETLNVRISLLIMSNELSFVAHEIPF